MNLEFHAWPVTRMGGQHVRRHIGVLCLDTETGVAAYVCSERSWLANQKIAEERVGQLIAGVNTGWAP